MSTKILLLKKTNLDKRVAKLYIASMHVGFYNIRGLYV